MSFVGVSRLIDVLRTEVLIVKKRKPANRLLPTTGEELSFAARELCEKDFEEG